SGDGLCGARQRPGLAAHPLCLSDQDILDGAGLFPRRAGAMPPVDRLCPAAARLPVVRRSLRGGYDAPVPQRADAPPGDLAGLRADMTTGSFTNAESRASA